MKTAVAVAPEPKPSKLEDILAFMDLCLPMMTDKEFFEYYNQRRKDGWRLGQTFMNVLPNEYYSILSGSVFDPFYTSDVAAVARALDYLLERI